MLDKDNKKVSYINDLRDFNQVLEAGLEPAQPQWPKDFKSFVSTIPPFEHPFKERAENETRTRDPNLGKVMLYQLSYFRKMICEEKETRTPTT